VEELSRKFSGKISVDKYDGNGLLSEAANKLISSSKKSTANRFVLCRMVLITRFNLPAYVCIIRMNIVSG